MPLPCLPHAVDVTGVCPQHCGSSSARPPPPFFFLRNCIYSSNPRSSNIDVGFTVAI